MDKYGFLCLEPYGFCDSLPKHKIKYKYSEKRKSKHKADCFEQKWQKYPGNTGQIAEKLKVEPKTNIDVESILKKCYNQSQLIKAK